MKRKIVLFLGGGAMAGVFGAGIVTALQEMDFYDDIKAIHAVSAGALNGAYFLTKQTRLGSSIYWEDLNNDFIFSERMFRGIIQRYWSRYVKKVPREKIIDAVDIDYLFDVVSHKKVLDVKKLRASKIPLYARLLDADNGELKDFDVRCAKVPLGILKAAVSLTPYYSGFVEIEGRRYIDAGLKELVGLRHLLDAYPNSRIAVVMNYSLDYMGTSRLKTLSEKFEDFAEGTVANTMYGIPLLRYMMQREDLLARDIRDAMNNPRVLLVVPPDDNPSTPFTTDPAKLKQTFALGKEGAKKIREFVYGRK